MWKSSAGDQWATPHLCTQFALGARVAPLALIWFAKVWRFVFEGLKQFINS